MALKKRSLSLAGHATSIALEPEFWSVLNDMAEARGVSISALIAGIDAGRASHPLASACRLAALDWARAQPGPGDGTVGGSTGTGSGA